MGQVFSDFFTKTLTIQNNAFGKKPRKRKNTRKNTTKRTNEALWKRVVQEVKKGSKGGSPGQWSARKAQLAVALYKKRGGGYRGKRSPNNSLTRWSKQKWRTKSGRPSTVGPRATGERYLPSKAIKKLSSKEYQRTTAAKRRATRKGKQYSSQPKKIAKKTKRYR